MAVEFDSLNWHFFKGNSVHASLIQKVCLFRSFILFDSGFRKSFDTEGANYGDIQYSDFESFHIIASLNNQILGTIRITPSKARTVTESILGKEKYLSLLSDLKVNPNDLLEINRLMVDSRFRKLNLGRSLIFSAIALIENLWVRDKMTIIGSAGNCSKQTQFCLNHTDFHKIEFLDNFFSAVFSDEVTVLKYALPPYSKGTEQIEYFRTHLNIIDSTQNDKFTAYFEENYRQIDIS